MPPFDAAPYLAPPAGPGPCGRDIEVTGELNALADSAKEPEEPGIKGQVAKDERNWRDIRNRAQELLKTSTHLRVAGYLARSLIHTDGLVHFCGCVAMIAQLVEQHWEHLYPPLDFDGDAIERINILKELGSEETLNDLRYAPILSVKGLGSFGIGDLMVAKGMTPARAGTNPPSPQVVLAALENAPVEELKPILEAAQQASQALQKIAGLISAKTNQPFVIAKLSELLKRFEDFLAPQVAKPSAVQPAPATAGAPAAPGAGPAAAATPAEPPRPAVPAGEIQTRQEVAQMIDKIIRYYERNEPSSPVPLILQRAKRLTAMNFMEIMRDLADKGLPQIEAVTGKENAKA
ncbi:MAG: type VI secretion system protein TssA [Myxococcales bacterium]